MMLNTTRTIIIDKVVEYSKNRIKRRIDGNFIYVLMTKKLNN